MHEMRRLIEMVQAQDIAVIEDSIAGNDLNTPPNVEPSASGVRQKPKTPQPWLTPKQQDEVLKKIRPSALPEGQTGHGFDTGHYYKQVYHNGEASYMLVGPRLKNGSHLAITIDDYYRPIAKAQSTNSLTKAQSTNSLISHQWHEIAEQDVPSKLLLKLKDKAASRFG